jgi:hypothetical protein
MYVYRNRLLARAYGMVAKAMMERSVFLQSLQKEALLTQRYVLYPL